MKFGYEWIVVVLIAFAAVGIIIRFILPNITSEETDPGDDDESGPGIGERLRGMIPGNMVVKVATLAGWGLFLIVLANSFPDHWKSWYSTGVLFWICQLVVAILVLFPIWQRSNNFGRIVVAVAVVVLIVGTINRMGSGSGSPSASHSASHGSVVLKNYTPVSPDSKPIILKPLAKNPKREWAGPYVIPPGKQLNWKTLAPDGTRVYFRINEDDSVTYREDWRSVGDPLLYKVITMTNGTEALTPIQQYPPGRMVEFLSGEQDTKVVLEIGIR
jgi:hypothetical protein